MYLLDLLVSILPNEYEVYYRPFLNGDEPDIVVIRKEYQVLIIEVKAYLLEHYSIDDNQGWKSEKIIAALHQVKKYKDNLYNLHIKDLLEKKINNAAFYGIISCAVYFHNGDRNSLEISLKRIPEQNRKYIKVFGRDSTNKQDLNEILENQQLYRQSSLFDEGIYKSFKEYLQPPLHILEQVKIINLNSQQQQLSESKPRPHKKIKGVAGSGKTLILATRAVNAHKRTGSKILILTYNITLKNYIHDRISDVREEFDWSVFYINNYHNFISAELNNLGIEIELPGQFDSLNSDNKTKHFEENYYSNEKIFKDVKESIRKYEVILIDEVQDYKEDWQRIIKRYFLAKDGEYVVFGDVKQNLYNRDLDEYKNFKTVGITGVWNVLKKSFRLSPKIANIAIEFQKTFFAGKYSVDKVVESNIQEFSDVKILYKYLYYRKSESLVLILREIYSLIHKLNKHRNDICFLSPTVEILRELDYLIRSTTGEKTQTIFETKETYEKLQNSINCQKLVKSIRNSKKANFWMNSRMVKLSTIHSFKGWEIDTLVLVLESDNKYDDKEIAMDELVYTAVTRARHNLIVINIGNSRYHNFFAEIAENDC